MFWTETLIPPQPAHYENVARTEALPPPIIAMLEPPFLSHQGVATFEKGKGSRNEDMCLSAWSVTLFVSGEKNSPVLITRSKTSCQKPARRFDTYAPLV